MLKTKLYDYQKKAEDKAVINMNDKGFHGLFFDMGKGKSLTTFGIISRLENVDCAVAIMPKGLLYNFKEEILKHYITPPNILVWGTQKAKTKKYRKSVNEWKAKKGFSYFLVNIEAFSGKPDSYKGKNPKDIARLLTLIKKQKTPFVLLDESSFIKSATAQRTKNLITLFKDWPYKTILTGTEITKTVMDLFTQFRFLCYNFWKHGSYNRFKMRYADWSDVYVQGGKLLKNKKFVRHKNLEELMERINPYISRVNKEEGELPDKVFIDLYVEPSTEQKRVYDELKDSNLAKLEGDIITVGAAVVLFNLCKQIVGGFIQGQPFKENPKMDALIADLHGKGKSIVASCYIKEIQAIETAVNRTFGAGSALTFYGGTVNREEVLKEFRENEDVKVLVLNPAVGGYGLNLQFCSLMYIYSLPPKIEELWQLLDRIHRIGQTETCFYKFIRMKGTIDMSLKKMVEKRTALRESIRRDDLKSMLEGEEDVFDDIEEFTMVDINL